MKISPYRTGELRFGTRDQTEPIHSEVTTWTMTPEQLEEYRNRPKREQIKISKPIKMPTKKKEEKQMELTRELYMDLKAKGKTDKQIMGEYGLHSNHMQKLKNKWGLVKKKQWQEDLENVDWKAKYLEIVKLSDEKHNELETALAEKIKAYAELESACTDIESELITSQQQVESLQKELKQQKEHNDKLTRTIIKQEEEILKLDSRLLPEYEDDLGFEEMKDELAMYKERAEKLGELVKLYI